MENPTQPKWKATMYSLCIYIRKWRIIEQEKTSFVNLEIKVIEDAMDKINNYDNIVHKCTKEREWRQ